MPERARRMMSFLLAALALFAVGRVIIAYATRPSRWTTRFSRTVNPAASVESTALSPVNVALDEAQTSPDGSPTKDDLVAITSLRAAAIRAIYYSNVDAYVRYFATDVVTFTITGTPIVSSSALRAETDRILHSAQIIDVFATAKDMRVLGATVFEEGNYAIQLRIGGADVEFKGRYAALWKRVSGDWRIIFEAVRAD